MIEVVFFTRTYLIEVADFFNKKLKFDSDLTFFNLEESMELVRINITSEAKSRYVVCAPIWIQIVVNLLLCFHMNSSELPETVSHWMQMLIGPESWPRTAVAIHIFKTNHLFSKETWIAARMTHGQFTLAKVTILKFPDFGYFWIIDDLRSSTLPILVFKLIVRLGWTHLYPANNLSERSVIPLERGQLDMVGPVLFNS